MVGGALFLLVASHAVYPSPVPTQLLPPQANSTAPATADILVRRTASGDMGFDLTDDNLIANVVPGTDAEAKLSIGDKITAVDGEALGDRWTGDVTSLHPNATAFTFTVQRGPASLGGVAPSTGHSSLPGANTPVCTDNPGWKSPSGQDCLQYEERGWCYGGALVTGQEATAGRQHGFPEQNCCVCGGGVGGSSKLSTSGLSLPPLTISPPSGSASAGGSHASEPRGHQRRIS